MMQLDNVSVSISLTLNIPISLSPFSPLHRSPLILSDFPFILFPCLSISIFFSFLCLPLFLSLLCLPLPLPDPSPSYVLKSTFNNWEPFCFQEYL